MEGGLEDEVVEGAVDWVVFTGWDILTDIMTDIREV